MLRARQPRGEMIECIHGEAMPKDTKTLGQEP